LVGPEGTQEGGEADQGERGDGGRGHAVLDRGRHGDGDAASERCAGTPAQSLAQAAARHRERPVEAPEAGGHPDRRLVGGDPDRQRGAGRDGAGEAGSQVEAAPLDAEGLGPQRGGL
jgi:hypothetical protein